MDTIFALATAQGRAGVSVIRISGPDVRAVLLRLIGVVPRPRVTRLSVIKDENEEILDQCLALFFEEPGSFTGEDVAELQVHGGPAVVSSVLSLLGRQSELRLALPGEFTRRALENGQLSLTEVEGLADLIDAETEAQRRQAQRLLSGALGEKVENWRTKLIRATALIEATIDFADEDVPEDVTEEVVVLLSDVATEIQAEILGSFIAERLRHGFEVAIVGPPNVGKSTLLNYLAGRDAAITSEIAGTTRDVIEVQMDLKGLPVTLLDTAGLRESDDKIESLGIQRASHRAKAADLRVFLTDDMAALTELFVKGDIIRHPKADQGGHSDNEAISGLTGVGVESLSREIGKQLEARLQQSGLAVRERHRVALQDGLADLNGALEKLSDGPVVYDIVAEELRRALRCLEALIGKVDVENFLDEIFASFCLGK